MNSDNFFNLGQHTVKSYDAEIEEIRSKVLAMGGMVSQQLTDAISAITTGDSGLGEKVVNGDYKINALEVEIDEECGQVLARRQPIASDLRFILSVIKTITDLERMGDEAERIGRMAVQLAQHDRPRGEYRELKHLGEKASHMLNSALDAFARTDVEAAVRTREEDQDLDREYESIMRQMITLMMEDPRYIPRTLEAMWSARALERIGDRACNICEYVIFLVKGRDVRHTSWEQVQAELRDED
ncbi:MAG: phosphate signaling complex protein PhoU [Gammaproteobacteria bacterium]|nr:phosphate signaling complex protein PhoU [Gammaproteobacteria bacterium]